MRFKYFFENVVASPQDLPPIPPDCVRLTHFTNNKVANQIVGGGENFSYQRVGITSTTDAFSNNNQVFDLLKSGNTGAFNRSSFGSAVLLMDIPNDQYRIHRALAQAPGEVDNKNILGYVDCNSMDLERNPRYAPGSVNLQPRSIPRFRSNNQGSSSVVNIPAPQNNPSKDVEIW